MDLFHRLGLSSHPNTIRAQLQSAADHFDKEILAWKTQIEVNRKQLKLIEEINNSQTRSSEDVDSIRVSRGDWLGNPANFKGACYCYGFSLVTWY